MAVAPLNQPLPHKAIKMAAAVMQVATTLSLCKGHREATKPPKNMPAAAHSI